MRKDSKGFSLIELLIVVAIILIIAAIAIPDLLKSRVAANQASAVGSLRTINTSEVTYSSTYTSGYSVDLASLDGPAGGNTAANSSLLDSVLGSGVKSQYTFLYTAIQTSTAPLRYDAYSIQANPVQACGTGNGNCYYTDMSAVIRFNTQTAATSSDSPLAG